MLCTLIYIISSRNQFDKNVNEKFSKLKIIFKTIISWFQVSFTNCSRELLHAILTVYRNCNIMFTSAQH